MKRLWTVMLAAGVLLGMVAPVAASTLPDRIDLPDDFAPEGIAVGDGSTFYTGSLAGAGIWRGDLETGEGSLLVEGGGPFVGMKVDAFDRLWVAGGPGGNGYLFDAVTGDLLEEFAFAAAPTFVNDVVVTDEAAYFTDSMRPTIYRVPIGCDGEVESPEAIALDPNAIDFQEGAFNLNGIEATRNGETLISVNSTAGGLYTIDAASGDASRIDLGGASVANGDGLLLDGRTLFVVRNELNQVAVLDLARDLETGDVVEERSPDDVDVPTTLASFDSSLYLVNARFGTTDAPPIEYWITRIDR